MASVPSPVGGGDEMIPWLPEAVRAVVLAWPSGRQARPAATFFGSLTFSVTLSTGLCAGSSAVSWFSCFVSAIVYSNRAAVSKSGILEGGQHSGQWGQEHVIAVVELTGSTAKCVSDKREKQGCQPGIKLESRRPQRLPHHRPEPGFVAGVHLLDFGIVQSVNFIRGECLPMDHQSILPSLASHRDRSEPFAVSLHPFFLWWRVWPVESPRLDQRQRPAVALQPTSAHR